jgi:putative hydrolase of the HAD superfamily
MLKAVLFDLDETLIDWSGAEPWEDYLLRRLSGVFNFVHSDVCPLNQTNVDQFFTAYTTAMHEAWIAGVRDLRAPSAYQVLLDTLSNLGAPSERLKIEELMSAYAWEPVSGVRTFPDVLDALSILQENGIELGIVTNASYPMAHRDHELEAVGLLELFPNCRIAAVDVGYLKPHRIIFEHALSLLNVRPEEAVFVGDNLDADVSGAQGAGMLGVLRVRDMSDFPIDSDIEPDGMITSLHDLLPLLDQWYPGWRKV